MPKTNPNFTILSDDGVREVERLFRQGSAGLVARYFFTVLDDEAVFVDNEGQSFESSDAAIAHAGALARELGSDGTHYHGSVIVVTDERGRELARIPVVDQ